jgi:hypothetical protein
MTIDSIRNHTARHFPVQHVAKATYREILERRAKENSVDFVEGVATAITLTGPRELVHGERESFIGGYRWQRSGPGVGSPGPSVGGGGCSRVSSR